MHVMYSSSSKHFHIRPFRNKYALTRIAIGLIIAALIVAAAATGIATVLTDQNSHTVSDRTNSSISNSHTSTSSQEYSSSINFTSASTTFFSSSKLSKSPPVSTSSSYTATTSSKSTTYSSYSTATLLSLSSVLIPAKTPQNLTNIPLACDAPSGCAYHWHVHLDIFVNGSSYVQIPSDIGAVNGTKYTLHTHDNTGIIHIEAPLPAKNFTLQQVFEVWGYPQFDSKECLIYHNQPVEVFVNGMRWIGTPIQDIPLTQHLEIAVIVGAIYPAVIPSSYSFPSGE